MSASPKWCNHEDKEQLLKEALSKVDFSGERPRGVRAASGEVPYSTLRRYAMERVGHPDGSPVSAPVGVKRMGRPPNLSPMKEELLAACVRARAASFQPMSSRECCGWARYLYGRDRSTALETEFVSKNGVVRKRRPWGKRWAAGFKQRHGFSSRKPEAMTPGRVRALSRQNLKEMFEEFKSIYERGNYNTHPECVWNVDETGMEVGASPRSHVLAPRGARSVGLVRPNTKTRMTAMCCVSAAGVAAPVSFFYRTRSATRASIPQGIGQSLEECPKGWTVMHSAKGMANGRCFNKWLRWWITWLDTVHRRPPFQRQLLAVDASPTHFPLVGRRDGDDDDEWDLHQLLLDGHIDLCFLKPSITSVAQPLDVGVFGPLKQAFGDEVDGKMFPQEGGPPQLEARRIPSYEDTPAIFAHAWERVVTREMVVSAFRGAGIWPLSWEVLSQKAAPASPPGVPDDGHDLLPSEASRGPYDIAKAAEKTRQRPNRNTSILLHNACGLIDAVQLAALREAHQKTGENWTASAFATCAYAFREAETKGSKKRRRQLDGGAAPPNQPPPSEIRCTLTLLPRCSDALFAYKRGV